jgi:hypothetical protein
MFIVFVDINTFQELGVTAITARGVRQYPRLSWPSTIRLRKLLRSNPMEVKLLPIRELDYEMLACYEDIWREVPLGLSIINKVPSVAGKTER